MANKKASSEIVTVTPRMAHQFLTNNIANRKLRESRVVAYMGILERGEWILSPDAAAFDTDGALRNGQHRLTAIERSKISGEMLLLRDIPAETQAIMDRGLNRTTADALRFKGYTNVNVLGAALNWLFRLDYIYTSGNVNYSDPSVRPSTGQLIAMLDDYSELPETAKASAPAIRALRMRPGVTVALHETFNALSVDDTKLFFSSLTDGEGLKKSDPIFHLRKLLIEARGPRTRLADFREAALIIKAWNAWRNEKSMQSLSWRFSPTNKETFPEPV